MAKVIDGKAFAEGLRGRIAKAVSGLKAQHGFTPGLAVVLVGVGLREPGQCGVGGVAAPEIGGDRDAIAGAGVGPGQRVGAGPSVVGQQLRARRLHRHRTLPVV